MKFNNISFVILIPAVFLLISCDKKWLDVKSNKRQAIPSTLKDFQALLDNSTPTMNNSAVALGEVSSDGHYVAENTWTNATSNNAKNPYTWSHNLPYRFLFSWDLTYLRIFHANVALEGLKKIQPFSDSEKEIIDNIKGQALFHRAEAFFWLCQLYAQPYNSSSAATDLGIPLRLNTDVSEASVRTSVKTNYDLIISNLKEAIRLLPDTPAFPTRPGKPAVYAQLARVYLSMNEYDSVFLYSNKCLELYHTLIDFNLRTPANFMGGFSSSPANTEVIFHNTMYTSELSNFLTTRCLIDATLYDQYAGNDLRRTLFFRSSGGNLTFRGNYHNNATSLFCGIATDEVYLNRAECYARMGDINNAMSDLNTLLSKRFDTSFIQYAAATADEALITILSERKKELILRGLRWMDLRRLNKEDQFKTTLQRVIGGNEYTLEPGSYKYTFPIPDDVIAISRMQQTTGW